MSAFKQRLELAPGSTAEVYFTAVATAERRALHSYFDQHILEDDELGYIAVDEAMTRCRRT